MNHSEIAKKWLQAFNDHNLERLLSLYHEDAEHYSPKLKSRKPETGGFIKGKTALASWWQDAFERIEGLQYIEKTITANDERVFIEYQRIVPREQSFDVAEVLEIRDHLIVASRVYHG